MLTMACSPCPNDTFMLCAIATGALSPESHTITTHFHDIEQLNEFAMEERYDFTKLSFHAWLLVRDRYDLLDAGGAFGFGCGPVVVAREPIDRVEASRGPVAVPGELTTANLLFRLWAPHATYDKLFVRYDEIIDQVLAGRARCGVVIHESRFVFEAAGLHRVVDLGQWWKDKTGLPIPLGCLAARKAIHRDLIIEFEKLVRRSIETSRANPGAVLPYIRAHAKEIDEQVLSKHIETFVNDHSLSLGTDGLKAIARLEKMAIEAGVIQRKPKVVQ